MTTFAVYSDGSLRLAGKQMHDIPAEVDSTTVVYLDHNHDIVIRQDAQPGQRGGHVIVRDAYALTDALTRALLAQAEHRANDDRPIDQPTRAALFAALRDHYGRNLNRDERLAKLSVLAGKPITSLADHVTNMTRADASRVLDILSEL